MITINSNVNKKYITIIPTICIDLEDKDLPTLSIHWLVFDVFIYFVKSKEKTHINQEINYMMSELQAKQDLFEEFGTTEEFQLYVDTNIELIELWKSKLYT